MPQPAAVSEHTEEGLYQEVGDIEKEEDELYQDTAAPSQRNEPEDYTEEDYYQV